ncbi:serine/threonine-protein kinase brsk2-like protein [Anaeramoeba flamelloides]|uniref:Serine/threonine-protein kinase brsk2-like protein n=1 Tax=Anaeramoeba flamelloides TaxID=1746091 RepID=A0ABQ8YTP0_9EUKA|nr:serine/threonine-protein kinase brsk2-like protein [Anaeramoeba flamelloides]
MSEKVGPYILGKTLGEGSTGKVKEGVHESTGKRVAIKIISKINLKPNQSIKIHREIAILRLLSHPHILDLYDVYETTRYLFLILELVEGGELFDYLISRGILPRQQTLMFFQQIILGLEYMHNHLICHRDLKPENLLLDKNDNIKIADFGMAQLMKTGNLLSTSCGSPHYASPEVIKGEQYDGKPADIWCCGIILFALLSGRLPFDSQNIRKLLIKVKRGDYIMPKNLKKIEKDLIRKILVVDPKKRITIEEIKQHPFFTSNFPSNYLFPSFPLSKTLTVDILKEKINKKILSSLVSLGWSKDKNQLIEILTSKEISHEKIFYHLYEKNRIREKKKRRREKKENKKLEEEKKKKKTISQQEEFEQGFNNDLLFGTEQDFPVEQNSEDEQEWLSMEIEFAESEEGEEKIERKGQDIFPQNKTKTMKTKSKKIKRKKPKHHMLGESLPFDITRKMNPNEFQLYPENEDGVFAIGTPRFHRTNQMNTELEELSPKNNEILFSKSPKKKWFGSIFSKKSLDEYGTKNILEEAMQNIEKEVEKEEKEKLEKLKLKKLKKKIAHIKRQSNDTIMNIGIQIQKVLTKLDLKFSYPHEFCFKIFSDDIKMRIEIDEMSKFKYIIHFYYRKGDIKIYETKLKNILRKLPFKFI